MSNDLTLAQRLEQAAGSAAQSWIITELLLNAYPPVIRESVIAAAVPHWFTAEILAVLLDLSVEEAEERYNALQQLSLVQPFGGLGCTLHDLTRNGILKNLVTAQRDLLQRYSEKLLTYFITSDDPQREVERIYHLLIVNSDAGHRVLQQIARFWRNIGDFAAVENLLRHYRELIELGGLTHEHQLVLEQQEYWSVVALADYGKREKNDQSEQYLREAPEQFAPFEHLAPLLMSMQKQFTIQPNPWAASVDEVVAALNTDVQVGLTAQAAAQRLQQIGPNTIPEPTPDPLWKRYRGQLTGDAVVRLLLIGGVASLVLGDYLEGVAIIIMLNIMAGFGLWQEGRATDAARALRSADTPFKLVVRDGVLQEHLINEIVPGDIVYLPTGAIAPADGRIVASVNAEKDTNKLTGESFPVKVEVAPLPSTTVVNEQYNMIHRGNAVIAGILTMVVTATGGQTEIGKIAATLAENDEAENRTSLDEQLDTLGAAMTKIFIWIAAVVIGLGLVREFYTLVQSAKPIGFFDGLHVVEEAFINAVALLIAAIPEGLPAVLTITLAIAGQALAKRGALVRGPKAVEGSGSMTVLLTDKTGTLTANEMTVTHLYLNGQIMEAPRIDPAMTQDPTIARALRIAHFCNNNSDPTESALLRWGEHMGFAAIGGVYSRAVEHQYDQSLKRMTTVCTSRQTDYYHIFTKGAPEHVLELCHQIHLNGQDIPLTEAHRHTVRQTITELARRGLRVIALADRLEHQGHTLKRTEAETNLVFVGLCGIMDPPREDVAPAVLTLKQAGIRTVMVTGDNPVTADAIARSVGIIEEDLPYAQAIIITGDELRDLSNPAPDLLRRLQTVRVFARVSPQHKAEIVRLMQEAGFIVGMTGDGVNDAIALQKSDVGFAMGNGTDVAREASAVVLTNSRFSTIPVAVEEGRNVLYRIRLYLSYILSGNGCEVGTFVVAYLFGLPIPLTALVLLVINFATDRFPALAMAFEAGEENVMARRPRKRNEPFITPIMWVHISVQTVVATVVIMAVYYLCYQIWGTSLEVARAAAFMTYISQKLYRAFTARSMTRNLWEIGLFSNRWTIGAVLISLAIALFFVYAPVINTVMGMAALDFPLLLIVAVAGLLPPIAEEVTKLFLQRIEAHLVSLA